MIRLCVTFMVIVFSSSVACATDSLVLQVHKGDTISGILKSANFPMNDIANATKALRKIYDPSNLKIGQQINVSFNIGSKDEDELSLRSIKIKTSALEEAHIVRNEEGGFSAKKRKIPTTVKLKNVDGVVNYALFSAISKAKIPNNVRDKFIQNYSYDIDFQRDIRSGDSFSILYEQIYDDKGNVVGSGDIIYSSLTNKGNTMRMYRYETTDGKIEYYDASGKSIKKSFLRTPVDGARITSRFGKRKHPILGYSKMHKGLDFGAPRGTPIYAAGDGVVVSKGRKGAYGNYIKIRHGNGYYTAYAHLKGYAKKIRKGKRIKQGQVIGYVGSTGRSTGPHLHYEVLRGGRHINPLAIKTTSQRKLKSLSLAIFNSYRRDVAMLVNSINSKNKLAAKQ